MSRPEILVEQFHIACRNGDVDFVRKKLASNPDLANSCNLSKTRNDFALHSAVLCEDDDKRFQTLQLLFASFANPCCYNLDATTALTGGYEKLPRISKRIEKSGMTPLDLSLFSSSKSHGLERFYLRIAEILALVPKDQAIFLLEEARDFVMIDDAVEGKDSFLRDLLTATVNKFATMSEEESKSVMVSDLLRRKKNIFHLIKELPISYRIGYDSGVRAEEQVKVFENPEVAAKEGGLLVMRSPQLLKDERKEGTDSASAALLGGGGAGLRRSKTVIGGLASFAASDLSGGGAAATSTFAADKPKFRAADFRKSFADLSSLASLSGGDADRSDDESDGERYGEEEESGEEVLEGHRHYEVINTDGSPAVRKDGPVSPVPAKSIIKRGAGGRPAEKHIVFDDGVKEGDGGSERYCARDKVALAAHHARRLGGGGAAKGGGRSVGGEEGEG